jgi:hypothetical protein
VTVTARETSPFLFFGRARSVEMKQLVLVLVGLVLAPACKDREEPRPTSGTAVATGTAETVAPERPALPEAPSTGIPECDDYVQALDRFVACDKIEQPSKDAALAGLERVRGEWKAIARMPADARQATIHQCQSSVRAIEIALEHAGCQ